LEDIAMTKKTTTPAKDVVKKDNSLHAMNDLNASDTRSHEGELSDAELESAVGGVKHASSLLMKACATGVHLKEATITQ
jgi:hypothetical protein